MHHFLHLYFVVVLTAVAFVHARFLPAPTPLPTAPAGNGVRESRDNVQTVEKRLFGVCVPFFPWLGDCSTTTVPIPSAATSIATTAPPTATPTTPAASTTSVSAPWSYPQPAVPARTYSAPASAFTVANGGFISSWATTRYYTLNLGFSGGAPDGFRRRMKTINNQFPGPVLEGNQGDTMVITVNNNLDEPQAIHWHGMRQNHSNWADGVPGVSQCSIPVGGSFTYRFTLESEAGTYWYHSHYANTMADGIQGALIVHSNKNTLKKYTQYGDERIVYLTDWQHDDSNLIVHGLEDITKGYRGSPIPPEPDSILLNGKGQANCANSQRGVPCNSNNGFSEVKAVIGDTVRLRLINTGNHAMIRFSIDNHMLQVVEVDDTEIEPVWVKEVPVNSAQRYSVLVKLDKGSIGQGFWMRANAAMLCLNPAAPPIGALGILRYTDWLGWTWLQNGNPTTQPWAGLGNNSTDCVDLDELVQLRPKVNEGVGGPVATTVETLSSHFGQFIGATGKPFIGFSYHGTYGGDKFFMNYINDPLLRQVEAGKTIGVDGHDHVANILFPSAGVADLIINQLDPFPLSHPFHIHGRPFHIIARGKGIINKRSIPDINLNLKNPLRRDTITLNHNSWAIVRIITDTPGVWPIHCHIGWHLSVGKLGVITIRPDEIKKFTQPTAWNGLCAGTDINEVGPARRDLGTVRGIAPPQARARHAMRDDWVTGAAARGEPEPRGEFQFVRRDPSGEMHDKLSKLAERDLIFNGMWMNDTWWKVPGFAYEGPIDDTNRPPPDVIAKAIKDGVATSFAAPLTQLATEVLAAGAAPTDAAGWVSAANNFVADVGAHVESKIDGLTNAVQSAISGIGPLNPSAASSLVASAGSSAGLPAAAVATPAPAPESSNATPSPSVSPSTDANPTAPAPSPSSNTQAAGPDADAPKPDAAPKPADSPAPGAPASNSGGAAPAPAVSSEGAVMLQEGESSRPPKNAEVPVAAKGA